MDRRFQYVRKRLLRCILPGLKRLPPRRSSAIVAAFGPLEYAANPGLRRRYHEGIARAALRLGADWDQRQTALALSRNLARWMTRDLLLDGWPDREVNALFAVEGREHVEHVLGEGRGLILLFSHFGAHVHPTHWLMRQGHAVRWLTERPKLLSRFITRDFDTEGPTGQRRMFLSRRLGPGESAQALRAAVRALDAGLIVKVAGDVRWSGARTVEGPFLGRTYTFTTPWISLAALSGAPVVRAFCLMEPGGGFRIRFEAPIRIPPEARDPGHAGPWLRDYLNALEDQIRRHPENSNEYFFWDETDDFVVPGRTALVA